MKNEEELKEELNHMIKYFQVDEETDNIYIGERVIEKFLNFEGGDIVKNKTYNLLSMLNNAKKKSEEAFNKLMDRDVQEDIWYVV